MLLELTNNGLNRERDAGTGDRAMSPVKYLVLTDSPALTDTAAIRTLTLADINEVDRIDINEGGAVERVSAGTAKFHGHVQVGQSYRIRGICVLLEDGELYAYTPYRPESGGFDKPADLAFSFYVVHSHEQSAALTFSYEPLDTDSLAETVIEKAGSGLYDDQQRIAATIIDTKLSQVKNHISLSQYDDYLNDKITDLTLKNGNNQKSIASLLAKAEILTYASWSQFDYITELNRLAWGSGVTHARGYEYGGDSPHNLPTTIGYSAYNGHDHSNIKNMIGTAEFGVMWNGIYCRLRHNDDGLYRHADVGAVSFDDRVLLDVPALPSDIAAAATPQDQIDLAEKYIKIIAGELPQDAVADYANSARWILSGVEVYPEVYKHGESLKDPFAGHRHQINVDSVPELLKQEQFYNNGGHKNIRENSVGIAMAINDIDDSGEPVVVLWRYRFISADVGSLADYPIDDVLDYHDDAAYQSRYDQTIEQIKATRSCRFRVKQQLGQANYNNYNGKELIDKFIEKIPGLDGYGNTLTETYQYYGANDLIKDYDNSSLALNAGYYNRFYKMSGFDASNRLSAKRGFNDDRMWVARTTDDRIKQTTFGSTKLGFSGFIPLELNIQSFLNGNFNPYGIANIGNQYTDAEITGLVAQGFGKSQSMPLPGYNDSFYYYKNPADIFDGIGPTDPADTTVSGGIWITCADGVARKHFPSGYGYFLPTTQLIGKPFRTRYPIYYAAGEQSEAFKYLSAVQRDQQHVAASVISNKIEIAKIKKQLPEA